MFINDLTKYDRFKCVNHPAKLSIMLVETNKHVVYHLVCLLLKMILLLLVVMKNVEESIF
jgi:hypothetical protein